MLFNIKKCTAMHVGKQQMVTHYTMNDNHLDMLVEKKDLGVMIINDLKA